MPIKNKAELATSDLRQQALTIIESGIEAVLPPNIIKSAIKFNERTKILTIKEDEYDLSKGRIFVVGGGKAAGLMAQALETIIGASNITAGIVNCHSTNSQTEKIQIIKASHPLPNQAGTNGVKKMLELKYEHKITKDDLVLCLISGGGSSLMTYPVEGVSLDDIQRTTRLLLSCGAEIREINAIRKHLSQIKGGHLGKFFDPTRIISLIISDVCGDELDCIASGPTSPDPTTFDQAYDILKKYGLQNEAPVAIINYIKNGCGGEVPETPKYLANCKNYIIANNKLALEAMAEKAIELGLKPHTITNEQKGEPAVIAQARAKEIILAKDDYNTFLIGGETTPILPENPGNGGRNQHYVAASIPIMHDYNGQWVVASVGTDGSDYLRDIAGAIASNETAESLIDKKIDINSYLLKFDSNTLFKKAGQSLIKTGPTGTNVGDIMVYILK